MASTGRKVVCIHQPDFAPHLGFFHRLLISHHFVLLDDVQFIRRGWQHRDRIKGPHGAAWLTLSLRKGNYHQLIRDVVLLNDSRWISGNLNLLRECYRKSRHFDEVFPQVEAIYRSGHYRMIDFNRALLELAFKFLDISIPITYASQYGIKVRSSERLVLLVDAIGGDTYLTGPGSRDYLDEEIFQKSGVKVMWQDFRHPTYRQLHGDFEPMLSCLDVLFNCGRGSADVLRSTTDVRG
jgi:hypothetical protein